MESLVSDIPAREGKMANCFYSVSLIKNNAKGSILVTIFCLAPKDAISPAFIFQIKENSRNLNVCTRKTVTKLQYLSKTKSKNK
jgi:hypothetical protein